MRPAFETPEDCRRDPDLQPDRAAAMRPAFVTPEDSETMIAMARS
jgi:hypothetical protein